MKSDHILLAVGGLLLLSVLNKRSPQPTNAHTIQETQTAVINNQAFSFNTVQEGLDILNTQFASLVTPDPIPVFTSSVPNPDPVVKYVKNASFNIRRIEENIVGLQRKIAKLEREIARGSDQPFKFQDIERYRQQIRDYEAQLLALRGSI